MANDEEGEDSPSTAVDADEQRGFFKEGDTVLLIDRKDREYLRKLRKGRRFGFAGGEVDLSELIGQPEGSRIRSAQGQTLLAFRPAYSQLVPHLPRKAQVIYPKDAGSILVFGDIYPGARVVESGVGPGALTLALLRAIGPSGRLTSIDRRQDHVDMARQNVNAFASRAERDRWTPIAAEAADILAQQDADRVILDLPEPAPLVPLAAEALRPGGMLITYVPTTIQVKEVCDALREERRFAVAQTFETLQRYWHVSSQSVRPDHRMVAHTGFITTAWRMAEPATAAKDTRTDTAAAPDGDRTDTPTAPDGPEAAPVPAPGSEDEGGESG